MSSILDWWFSFPLEDRVGFILYPLGILGNFWFLVKGVKVGFKDPSQAKVNRRVDVVLIVISVVAGMSWLAEDRYIYVIFSFLMVVVCVLDMFVVNRWLDKHERMS